MPLPKRIDEDEETVTVTHPAWPTLGLRPMLGFAEAAFDFGMSMWRAAPATTNPPEPAKEECRVGEFYADYSLLTPEEIAAPDDAADALFQRSKRVSR